MDESLKFGLSLGCGIFLLLGLLIGVVGVIDYQVSKYRCANVWKDNKPEFSLFLGCTVQASDGTRVPSTNYRVIE